MALIYVKTKPGRRAYYEGRIIPQDKFIPVTNDPYIRRLVGHWQDLIVEENPNLDADKTASSTRRSKGESVKEPPGRPTEPSNNPAPGTGAPRPTN